MQQQTNNTATQPKGPKQFDGSTPHPPWFTYSLANFGVAFGIAANLWQVFTSAIAFFTMFTQGQVYQRMDRKSQGPATAAALAVSTGLALAFQLGVLFLVFRVHHEYQEQRAKLGDTREAIKITALQMVSHHRLMLSWSVISFIADTVGDFTFINFITNDPILLLAYTLGLYAVSTIILSASLTRQWAARIALENWKAFKAYARLLSLKAQTRQAKQQGAQG